MPDQSEHLGIVVGVDGSSASTEAVRWAARRAAMRDIGLTIVHASPPVVPGSSLIVWTGPIPSELMRAQEEQTQRLIDDAAKTANDTAGGLHIRTKAIAAAPVPALLELSNDAQMVVVGRRGRSSLPGVLLGSVSTAMIHRARCPVAVIHDESPAEAASTDAPVLVGIDGSPASELATVIAFDEASWRGVDLVALHAACDSDPFGIHELEWAYVEPQANEALAERLAGWQAGRNVTPTFVCAVWSYSTSPRTTSSSGLNPPSWSWSAPAATVNSPSCCSARSAPRWCRRPAHRSSSRARATPLNDIATC
jgi:nucleotide-binding universal stress UspA family protein